MFGSDYPVLSMKRCLLQASLDLTDEVPQTWLYYNQNAFFRDKCN
jgi:predicted TIM-barrel fold metal-dependent hydrolase